MVSRSMASREGKRRAATRLQLMSWSTPVVWPAGVRMGTTSIDFVR